MDTMGFTPKIEGLGREADHSPQSRVEVKNGGAALLPYLKGDSIQILVVVTNRQV
jgi:hypothetical protein